MPPLKLKYFYLAGDSDVEVQKNGLPACLTKILWIWTNKSYKKAPPSAPFRVFQKTKPMTPRYHFYYRFFNRSLCHVPDSLCHRWTCSPVTVRIRFGLMNLFRPKSSQGIIFLNICWLTPTVSSLKRYRTKKIVSWSLLLLFALETITDYSPFWKIVNRILCIKMYTGYLRNRKSLH